MKLKASGELRRLLTPTFIFLWLVMFLVEVVKSSLLVTILPVYMGSVLQLSTFAIGLSMSLQYIGDNFFRSPAGWLVERFGFRMTMVTGLMLSTAAVALMAWSRQAWVIASACTLLGIGSAPMWPCVLIGITKLTEKSKNFGMAMGVIQMATLGGTGTGPVVINFFVGKSYGPVFGLLLGCMFLALLLAMLLPGLPSQAAAPRQPSGAPRAVSPLQAAAQRLRQLLDTLQGTFTEIRTNLHVSKLIYPALFLQSFSIGLLTPVITLYIRTVLHLSPLSFSAMLIAGGGITVVGLIPIGKMVDKHGTRVFLNTGFLLAFCSILSFALIRDIAIVWLLVLAIGASYSLILPTWNTMLSSFLPSEEKGTIWGLFLTVQGCGMVTGPVVSGKLWDVFGPSAPFLTSAASMGILFLLHAWLTRPQAVNAQGKSFRRSKGRV